MKTQISRLSDQPARRYSGVYQQQGRMITDADWNELVEILKRRLDDALAKAIGSGMPQAGGLSIVQDSGGLAIVPGEVYVDGVRARFPGDAAQPVRLTAQVDFPGAPALGAGDAWIYVDVWERSVVTLEDPALRDPGLHGADTCTRTQTMVQVKWCPHWLDPEDAGVNPRIGAARCAVALPGEDTFVSADDGCIAAGGTAPRVGNYLFRVEVHHVEPFADGSIRLTLKWSCENGAEQHGLESIGEDGALQRDFSQVPEDFLAGRWAYELCDGLSELHLGVHLAPGFAPHRGELLDRAPGLADLVDAPWRHVRRWDGFCVFKLRLQGGGALRHWASVPGTLTGIDRGQALGEDVVGHGHVHFDPNARGGLLFSAALGSLGLDLEIADHAFVAGDHWLAVVREDAAVDDRVEMLNDGRPIGVVHHVLKLAEVRGGALVPVRHGSALDRQHAFPPLTALVADRIGYDPQATRERWLDIAETPVLRPQWARRIGGGGRDAVRALAADAAGNIVAGGSYAGALSIDDDTPVTPASGQGVFLAKWDASGATLWLKALPAGTDSEAQSVAVDTTGHIVLAGTFAGTLSLGGSVGTLTSAGPRDMFLARFAPDGTCLWARQFGGTGTDIGYAVALDRRGNIVLTGFFQGSANLGGAPLDSVGPMDIFVARFGPGGAHLWSKRFGGVAYDAGHSVASDAEGNVVLTGFFEGSADFGGGALTSAGKSDVFVARFDANGSHLWSRAFGATASDRGRDVAVDAKGFVVLTGDFQGRISFGAADDTLSSGGGPDIYLVKLAPDGSHCWSKSFPAPAVQQGHSLAVDSAGRIALTGQFRGTLDFGGGPLAARGDEDVFVASFDADGAHRYSARLGSDGADLGRGVAALPGGGLALAGACDGPATLGDLSLATHGGRDGFVIALAPSEAGPMTVQEALDQLAGGLESSDIGYELPHCPRSTPPGPSMGRLLGEKSGWAGQQRMKVDTLLDALLCEFDASTIPSPHGDGVTTVQASLERLWAEKVAKAGDRMTGALVITGGGLSVGDGADPGANNLVVKGQCTVVGDLVVQGATTTISTTNIVVEDNIVELNRYDGSGANTRNAGIAVYRGSAEPARVQFDEVDDRWKVGIGNNLLPIATGEAQDVVTGVVAFDGLPLNQEMVSPEIDPGLGIGPVFVELGVDDWLGAGYSDVADEIYRPVTYRAKINRTTGTFRVFVRRTAGVTAQARLRWWAHMPRAEEAATVTVSIGVTVQPTTASLQSGDTRQFVAIVTGSTAGVTWSATGGSISNAGLYTASAGGSFIVTAQSQADSSKRATATVTVAAISISVSPTSASLSLGQTRQFTATVSGTTHQGVTWSATGGSINQSTGLFTATAAGTFAVTATSTADPSRHATATVNVTRATVTIAPRNAVLALGQAVQMTATVTNATNTGVTWGGTSQISATGLFTAPSSLGGSPMGFRVTAQSDQDPTATDWVWVQVIDVTVSVTPASVRREIGDEAEFIATVSGGITNDVRWTVSGNAQVHQDPANSRRATVMVLSPANSSRIVTAISTEAGGHRDTATVHVDPINPR
jgi:hypothetical protein